MFKVGYTNFHALRYQISER